MFLFTYTAALLSAACAGCAAFLLLKKRDSVVARYLAYHAIGVALWVGSNAAADVSRTSPTLVFWSGMSVIGVCVLSTFYLWFADAFARKSMPSVMRRSLYALPTFAFSSLAFTEFSTVETIFPEGAPAQIVPGGLYDYVLLFLVVSLCYGSARLVVRYRVASAQERLQIRYIEAGFVALFGGMVLFNYVLPVLGELRFYSVGPQFSAVLVACCAYAILKHRMLDIKVAIQRGIIFAVLLAIVAGAYLVALQVTFFLARGRTDTSYLTASLVTTAAGIFGVPPLRAWFTRVTDRVFFKDRTPYITAMERLGEALNRNIDMGELLDDTSRTIADILRVRSAHFILIPSADEDAPADVVPFGIEDKVPSEYLEALDAARNRSRVRETIDCPEVRSAEVVVPVVLAGEALALLALSPKRSGDPFFSVDMEVLRGFGMQCAVAIGKARLHGEVKEYSERLEDMVELRTAEIAKLQGSRVQMMLDISHGLQTPLTVLRGQIDALGQRSPSEEVGRLEVSMEKISGFVQRLLRFADLSGATAVNKGAVDLSALLRGIVDYFGIVAEQRGIAIDVRIEEGIVVSGDAAQLEEMVLNVLGNAVKYIGEGKEIGIALARKGDDVMLAVKDRGIGMDREEREKVFTRFYRAAGSSGVQGSGLGLAICKRIAELHDGTIAVESAKGKGTTVTVMLPVAPRAGSHE